MRIKTHIFVFIMSTVFNVVLAKEVNITIINNGIDVDQYIEPHAYIKNKQGVVPSALFLLPRQGSVEKKSMDQEALLVIFGDPRYWMASFKGVKIGQENKGVQEFFICSYSPTKTQNIHKMEITVNAKNCTLEVH